jgi:hypothetical protein
MAVSVHCVQPIRKPGRSSNAGLLECVLRRWCGLSCYGCNSHRSKCWLKDGLFLSGLSAEASV